MSAIHDLQADIQRIVGPVRRATVSLGRDSRASGIVIGVGIVLTNAHAIRDRTTTVTFADGRTVQGTVAGVDAAGDLAVIHADTADVTPLHWSETQPAPGQLVLAGHGRSGVSLGLITSVGDRFRGPRGRTVSNAFEHHAPLNRGASGGPVVDVEGRLVGINTSRTDSGYQAVAASSDLHHRINALTAGQSVERPTLGIAIVEPAVARRVRAAAGLAERDGVLINAVAENSPAARAGLSQGDLIVAIGETPVRSIADVHAALDTTAPGTIESGLSMTVVRGADERQVQVQFGTRTA